LSSSFSAFVKDYSLKKTAQDAPGTIVFVRGIFTYTRFQENIRNVFPYKNPTILFTKDRRPPLL
jgi:hypothetical protein